MKNIEAIATILVLVGAVALPVACGSPTSGTCEETSSCASSTTDGGEGGGGGDSGADVVAPPVGCDPSADVKDAPKCVVNEFGVFVDAAGGSDASAGTREAPVKSIGAALGKLGARSRVYVCEGSYRERVVLSSAASIYGGLACGTWIYTGVKPKVAPGDAGFALEIAAVKGDVTLSDLAFLAADASDKGQSSVAVFVHDASNVLLLRTDLDAGAAKEGADGAAGTTGTITAVTGGGALNATGYPASGTTAGTVKTCTCSSGGNSAGGAGGGPLGAGAPGTPSLGGAAPNDGVGGAGNTSCSAAEPNGSGNVGAEATNAADATKVTALGTLDATGWKPQGGADGNSGSPGQGGGGGGGRDATSAGGGGACGGCGGSGGKAGAGGGASVALLSFESTIVLRNAKLTAKAAGQGGTGGAKGTGATGGTGANGGASGCSAGDGGKGADGGTGSGGAGGISAAVLHKGPAPTIDASTLSPGTKGAKGIGGTPTTNDGPDGQSANLVNIP